MCFQALITRGHSERHERCAFRTERVDCDAKPATELRYALMAWSVLHIVFQEHVYLIRTRVSTTAHQ